MTTFMLMRVNYDNRDGLDPHERYSKPVTKHLNDKFSARYEDYKIGGYGFHEGLNFAACNDGRVRIYIPPKPPSESKIDDDFVIFTFTYASEPGEGRNRIIGVQAGATIHHRDYKTLRPNQYGHFVKIAYQASAPVDLCTLFLTPSGVPPAFEESRHLPTNYRWGMGHRYFYANDKTEITHLHNILNDAHKAAKATVIKGANAAIRKYAAREVAIINRILRKYFSTDHINWGDTTQSNDVLGLLGKGRATTRKQLIEARLGQGRFRRGLEERWNYACAVTGCNLREALRASHMKPWSKSEHGERLDPCNGLLLEANLDALFDSYLISFRDNGLMLLSNHLSGIHQRSLRLIGGKLRKSLNETELKYLRFHRMEFERRNKDASM